MWRAVILSTFLAGTAFALPPGEHGRGFREGANHHLGDDSFVAVHGRAPTPADGEKTRMHDQLVYAHDLLAAKPATRPELTERRAQLLRYLADYTAAGITPVNTYVPWRSPVFIDARGSVCAVGYLIERDVGRALPERIAREHRLEFLEDIAVAMPEVKSWVEGSGFTLEELASIQPGYEGPRDMVQDGFDKLVNGAYSEEHDGIKVTGTIARGKMTGDWKATAQSGRVVGRGTLNNGAGPWASYRQDGTLLAKGAFEGNRAAGHWKFYHPSGNLAAEGDFQYGKRAGVWNFYYDTKGETIVSTGRFKHGWIDGTWKHNDAKGKLLATTSQKFHPMRDESGDGRYPQGYPEETYMTVTADKAGVSRHVTTGHPASNFRIDTLDGAARIHIDNDGAMFDDKDHALELVDGTWFADPCTRGQAGCTAKPVPVPAARAKAIAATLEANHRVREPLPAFMVPYLKDMGFNGSFRGDSFDRKDLTSMLGASIGWFIEFPHVDGAFVEVFATLPGYRAGKRMHGDTSPRGEDEYEYKHDVMADKDPVDADADE